MERIFAVLGALCMLCGLSSAAAPKVVFVTGDNEYGSELSMPMLAAILAERHGMKTEVLYSVNEQGQPDRDGNSIPGLAALQDADLAVFFMRYRQLPDEQLKAILDYAASGKPMIGLRTATHAVNYPGPPNNRWNAEFGRDTWGQQWIEHYGHGNSSQVRVVDEEARHPILRGVAPDFWQNSWLYVMNKGDLRLPDDCRFLMEGDAVKGVEPGGERFGQRQPVAWTRELSKPGSGKKRIFYTSLGHPRDFLNESTRRLLVNAVYWGLGREREIPLGGANVDFVGKYDPPDPH